jgi:acyl-homoserine-lactone acylase
MPLRLALLAVALLGASLPALAQRAEVLWDRYGVPHVYAQDTEAAFHAFGWAQMEAHADVMLRLYGLASGRAAEHWGPAYRIADRRALLFEFDRQAERGLAATSPEVRALVDSFVEGVNAYARAHPERIADSLRLMLPVTATDVYQLLASSLSQFSNALPAAQRWAAPRPPEPAMGSNAWAVTGPKSASGHAMLLANPHLPWTDEFRMTEARLSAPGLDLYGVTFIGHPLIYVGFTPGHGWTHTVNTQNPETLYELELAEGGYVFGGAVQPFEGDTLTYRVREGEGVTEEPFVRRRSAHGPVLAERDGRALAFRRVEGPAVLDQWWAMARATSLAEFEGALARQQLVGFTTTYADREGNILHYYGDATPVRARPERAFWAGIVPGDDPALLWDEVHPYEEMPRVVNPPSGWVQNANEASYWATWPLAFDLTAFPDYLGPRSIHLRAQRSIELLDTPEPLTFEAFDALRRDSRLLLADRVLPELLAAARASRSDEARRAADVLDAWDRTAEADSRGGVLFAAWVAKATDGTRLFDRAWTAEAPRTTPAGLADSVAAVNALAAAVQELEARGVPLDVPWGAVNRVQIHDADFPASGGSGGLGAFRVLTFQPDRDGRQRVFHGDTFVLAVEFAETPRARALLAYGNATQAGSPHRTDQAALAASGELREVRLTRGAVEADGGPRTVVLD